MTLSRACYQLMCLLLTALIPLLAMGRPTVQGGGSDGGADPKRVDATLLRQILLENDGKIIKDSMLNYLSTVSVEEVKDPFVKDLFERAPGIERLKKDILDSKYEEGTDAVYCKDAYGNRVKISTKFNQPRSRVCFDITLLAPDYTAHTSESAMIQLAALAFHEHLHHFQHDPKGNYELITNLEAQADRLASYVRLTARAADIPRLEWKLPVQQSIVLSAYDNVDACMKPEVRGQLIETIRQKAIATFQAGIAAEMRSKIYWLNQSHKPEDQALAASIGKVSESNVTLNIVVQDKNWIEENGTLKTSFAKVLGEGRFSAGDVTFDFTFQDGSPYSLVMSQGPYVVTDGIGRVKERGSACKLKAIRSAGPYPLKRDKPDGRLATPAMSFAHCVPRYDQCSPWSTWKVERKDAPGVEPVLFVNEHQNDRNPRLADWQQAEIRFRH